MLIAQITDLHVRPTGRPAYGRVDTNAMLAACVDAILKLDRLPDVVLATGDLADCGLDEEYALLRSFLSPLPMPVFLIPGNHDRRPQMRNGFIDHAYLQGDDEYLHYVVEDYPLRLIGLDTVVPGFGHGEMDDARLAWLEARLAEAPDRPTIVFMHHPPFPTGIQHMDRINCRNGGAMAAIIAKYPNVERVLAGHHHRPIQTRWAGTVGSIAPSPAHQVMLDLDDDVTRAMFVMEPPAYHLHLFAPETGVITHQAYIDDYDGPHPFVLDKDYPGAATD